MYNLHLFILLQTFWHEICRELVQMAHIIRAYEVSKCGYVLGYLSSWLSKCRI